MWMMSWIATASAAQLTLTPAEPTVRYYAELLVQPAGNAIFIASNNQEAIPFQHMLSAEFSCTTQPDGKGQRMICDVDRVNMQSEAARQTRQDAMNTIITEYTTLLESASVEVLFRKDGRIAMVDVEGVPQNNERGRFVHETLRQLMRRAFAPLDLQLPKRGEAQAGDGWKHKSGSLAFELFGNTATIGGSVLKYQVTEAAEFVGVSSEGYGTVGAGSTAGVVLGGEEGLRGDNASTSGDNLYKMVVNGAARYDTTTNRWIYAEYSAQGEHTRAAQNAPNKNYLQAAWIGRINADGTIEGLEGPRRLGQPQAPAEVQQR